MASPVRPVPAPRTTAFGPSTRYVVGAALGLAGYWLNGIQFPLLVDARPLFVLGGAPVLLAFFWAGVGPGLLAAAIAVIRLAVVTEGPAVAMLIYVLEPWIAYLVARRVGSVVCAVALFWLGIGWLIDIPLYGLIGRVPWPFLSLLFVKQLLNGLLNGLLVEVVLALPRVPRVAWHRSSSLQAFVFRRVLFVVVLPTMALGFLATRSFYAHRIDELNTQQLQEASSLRAAVRRFSQERDDALDLLARRIAARQAAGLGGEASLLESFHAAHPEFLIVGTADASGLITASHPAENARGESMVGLSASGRPYFQQARSALRTVRSPVTLGGLHVRDKNGAEAVVIVATPLVGPDGAFNGTVQAALDCRSLVPVLQAARLGAAVSGTIIDQDLKVVASLDPELRPGAPVRIWVPGSQLTHDTPHTFVYSPLPLVGTSEGRRGLAQRQAAYEVDVQTGWGVLVEIPLMALYARTVALNLQTVTFFAATLGLVYVFAGYVARSLSRPLQLVERSTSQMTAGRFAVEEQLAELGESPIAEVRSLGLQLFTMQASLADYRAMSEAREQESEERFRATFDQAAVGIAHVAPDCHWLRVNDRLAAIVGHPVETLIGQDACAIALAEDRERGKAMLARIAAGDQQLASGEIRYVREDGTITWTNMTASLVRGADGQPKYFTLVVENIAERKHLEQQLQQAQKMESIGRLAGGVAHDFNNLLTAILGYSELLDARLAPASPMHAEVRQIRQAAERAAALTAQLLAFARRQIIEPRVINLNDLVHNVEGMLRRLIGEDVMFGTELDPALPSVRADPGQVEQVVLNLVVNARDAMPGGGRVTIRTARVRLDDTAALRQMGVDAGEYVELSVSDTGIGMNEDVQARVFEPFFTTKEKGKGTGLGLATCYGIVKQAGGHIDVESLPGRGATFRTYWPRVDESPATSRSPAGAELRGGQETVLLAEDESAVAAIAARTLRARGYVVLQATNGAEALAVFAGAPVTPDLLVSDVVMPQMGGPELARRLRALRPGLKVLFISGYPDEQFSRGGPGSGAAFLQKPFTPDALLRAVRELLDRVEPRGESA